MRNYIRDKTKGGCYFLTFNLLDRKSQLLLTHINELRIAYANTVKHHRFHLEALVILPDHVHIMITLPEDSDNYAIVVASLKSQFSKQINKSEIITLSRQNKRERGLWQRRFWEHTIRDELDFNNHVDYIHYNPVKHKLVRRAVDWAYSSFLREVKKGRYAEDWATEAFDNSDIGE